MVRILTSIASIFLSLIASAEAAARRTADEARETEAYILPPLRRSK